MDLLFLIFMGGHLLSEMTESCFIYKGSVFKYAFPVKAFSKLAAKWPPVIILFPVLVSIPGFYMGLKSSITKNSIGK